MKRTLLNFLGQRIPIQKILLAWAVFPFSVHTSYSQKAEPFIYNCVLPGQDMTIDAVITNADASTFYRWQYKSGPDNWVCFINSLNTINGSHFLVAGATGTGANNAPTLTIYQANAALENVLVRVIMSLGADPCGNPVPGQVYGGDDEAPQETKYLRLHVFPSANSCPPNAYVCAGNQLVDGDKFYGGFEHSVFDPSSDTYTRNNFGGNASSDFVFGTGKGRYQDINNPFAMNPGFARNIAPHTGDGQLVVEGSPNLADRAWYKTIPVVSGHQYSFAVWVARVDDSDPIIELRANSSILIAQDISMHPAGSWNLVQGTYNAPTTGLVTFNIRDGRAGGNNNFSLDDICLRGCTNCATLELHQLYLSAFLKKNEVRLSWIAENEMGTTNFVIERSFDGFNFERMGSKPPSGPVNTPTAYHYSDDIQNAGIHNTIYYRIKALDSDGRHAFSNVVIIRVGKSTGIQAWPVPFNDQVNLTITATANSKINICLVNTLGLTIREMDYSISRGLNQLSIGGLEALGSGVYFLRITDKNKREVNVLKISR